MVFKTGEINNPKGNPNMNLKDAIKTGPKTKEGKLKSCLHQLSSGNSSKLVHYYHTCDRCPYGVKEKETTINGKINTIISPATCVHYKENKNKCFYDVRRFIEKLKIYYEIIESGRFDSEVMAKTIALESLEDANIQKSMEQATKGAPGFLANEYRKTAIDALEASTRARIAEHGVINRNLNMNVEAKMGWDDMLKQVRDTVVRKKEGEEHEAFGS